MHSRGKMAVNIERVREVFLSAQKQRSEEHSKVKPFIRRFCKNDTVLDIGCGSGIELSSLSDFCGYAVGIDIDKDVLAIAKRKLRDRVNVYLARSDARLLPFRPKCFSKILCFDVLEHFIFPQILINNMKHLLVSHGEVILRVPNKWSPHEILLMLISPLTKAKTGTWFVHHVSFFDSKSIKGIFISRDFQYASGYTYGSLISNIATALFTLISVLLNLIFYNNPIKRETILSTLRKHYPKTRCFIINSDSKLPSFSYLTMMFRLR